MYIKSIKIHFNMVKEPIVVHGRDAERLYNSDLTAQLIEVKLGNVKRYIPQSSILYIDVVPNEPANDLAEAIQLKYQAILGIGYVTKSHEDYPYWEIRDGVLVVGYRNQDHPGIDEVRDPLTVSLARELFDLDDQLTRLLTSER